MSCSLCLFSPKSFLEDSVNNSARLTSPVDSSDSHKLIGRMRNHEKRPVPVCWILSVSNGTAEPVNTNCPNSRRSSTSERIVSQSSGIVCHSSNRRGVSPFNSNDGSIWSRLRLSCNVIGLPSIRELFAFCIAVVDLPHHFGPCTKTAPEVRNLELSNWSAIRGLYSKFAITIFC